MSNMISYANTILFILQWLLIALPLPGYIHPDEYCQSTEIMASDILDVKAQRTWEWNSTEPARSVIFPALSAGLPFLVLKWISGFFQFQLSLLVVLVLPRVMMGLLTLMTESLLLKLVHTCDGTKDKSSFVLFLFRSSHVTLCFMNRTFSNTIETVAFVFVLLMVKNRESLFRFFRLQFLFGAVLVTAFFIRQTMIAFALFPLLVIAIAALNEINIISIIKSALTVGLGAIFAAVACICADSYYFSNGISLAITPINLIKYNQNVENLKLHGLHPWYLHAAVNTMLLFGPLYILFVCGVFKTILSCVRNLKCVFDVRMFFCLSVVVPLCVLSLVPHHEPRYILPLLVPIICYVCVCYPNLHRSKLFLTSCILFNTLGLLWFGFLHQAGLLPSLVHLHSKLHHHQQHVSATKTSIIFWKTYSVPQHLLMIGKTDSNVVVEDLAGSDWNVVETKIKAAGSGEVHLVCPSMFQSQISERITWNEKHSFFPHVSGDDLPVQQFVKFAASMPMELEVWLEFFKESFSLNVYHNISIV